ncbi:hypothetical protein X777_16014 [Ooceraea biroi]|uniref:Uncharacterized protein n=1 Tax=Ooceraea biroi TaxID=2015173 RepID=A0A026WTS9_OOCBI|nr:hypothetical protein X777_16014 [Ooceraea biroi]
MVPDLFHVVPIGDDTVFDGILNGEDTPLTLRLVTHVTILLSHAHHDSLNVRFIRLRCNRTLGLISLISSNARVLLLLHVVSRFFSLTWYRGLPTMEGNTARGASSPANPALHIPDPLSITRAATSSSHIFEQCYRGGGYLLVRIYREAHGLVSRLQQVNDGDNLGKEDSRTRCCRDCRSIAFSGGTVALYQLPSSCHRSSGRGSRGFSSSVGLAR